MDATLYETAAQMQMQMQAQRMAQMQNIAGAIYSRPVRDITVAYAIADTGLVSGYPTAVAPFDIDMARPIPTPLTVPDIHPFMAEPKPRRWSFDPPCLRTVFAYLAFAGMIAGGAWMLFT